MSAIQYLLPDDWIRYDKSAVSDDLMNAKASILALKAIPFQRRWVQEIEQIQLKMEVAGTSRIEGADFASNELEAAITAPNPQELITRSQRQAMAAVRAYRWIAKIPEDQPIDDGLIQQIHRLIVTDCDDDHCAPGEIRGPDQNVSFGLPKHRGACGGKECATAFERFTKHLNSSYKFHDTLIQALAAHYHLAAMHPFMDGNGRTTRALEALLLQRAGLKDSLFIALSNFYYEEKPTYLASLAGVRKENYDLTEFLKFGLKGIYQQTERLTQIIRRQVSKEIFRNLMNDLFTRLENTRKRVIVKRQLVLLQKLLNLEGEIEFSELASSVRDKYSARKFPLDALVRDIERLIGLQAVILRRDDSNPKEPRFFLRVNLDWPATITDTEFFSRLQKLPKSKTYGFLSR